MIGKYVFFLFTAFCGLSVSIDGDELGERLSYWKMMTQKREDLLRVSKYGNTYVYLWWCIRQAGIIYLTVETLEELNGKSISF